MKSLMKLLTGVAGALGLMISGTVRAAEAPVAAAAPAAPAVNVGAVPTADRPVVQMAILLDTSGSMNGLIDQARRQLWRIVGEFATAKRGGKVPVLEVALYHYGSPSLGAQNQYIRQVLPLTTDLDKVSEELFKLRISGGDEYCGAAIKKAVGDLRWSSRKGDLKMIFIAGNEEFTQGPVNYRDACKLAIERGITVNTIHCGSVEDGVNGKWKDGADLADGKYLVINQDERVVHIPAPQDKDLAKLGDDLNKTYVAFGRHGAEGAARQQAQDKAAGGLSAEALSQRNFAKANAQYSAGSWCLVDALKEGKVKLEDLKDEELPEELRKMTKEQRVAFIEGKKKEREGIQAAIKKLSGERDVYVAEELKKRTAAGKGSTLDTAVIQAVREQAAKQQFTFDGK